MRTPKRLAPTLVIGALSMTLAAQFSLALWIFSPIAIGWPDVLSAVWPATGDLSVGAQVIQLVRVPRAIGGIVIGAALALCGLMMQGATRNRLASPSLLGVTSGASLGLAIVSSGVLGASGALSPSAAAVLGGAVAWAMVFLLGSAWSIDGSKGRLILAGMTMAALCAGLTRLVVLLAEERALGVLNWLAGSLGNIRYDDLPVMTGMMVAGLAVSSLIAPKLNLLNLGDETAETLGVRVGTIRIVVFVTGCLIVGATVAVTGPIAFIGLMAPNIARTLVGSDYRLLVPASALAGSILLLGSDIVARGVAYPAEIAAGAVTALVGAPFFLIMARRVR